MTEFKYESMTADQQQAEQKRIVKNISFLKEEIARMEDLHVRMLVINEDISRHSKELHILQKQKKFAEQEVKVLCA